VTKTFVQIDADFFPGTIIQEDREHPVFGWGFFSYLSVDLGQRGWMHVEKWDPPHLPHTTEAVLQNTLAEAVLIHLP
jgi:hypothetical protein